MSQEKKLQYRAFISYSRKDAAVAKWLHRSIENYRPPRKMSGSVEPSDRLRPLFRDTDELRASADLGASLRQAILDSETMIVLCSPASATSRWVKQEITTFKQNRPGAVILPLIVSGDPDSEDEALQCFPKPLLYSVDSDGELTGPPVVPLAADLRQQGDGKRLARLKIVAALLDVKLDLLIQRDAQRRLRLMSILLSASLLVLLLMGGLAWTAYTSSLEARQARGVAEQRRAESEDLIEFMLGDMRQKLEPVGRLDVMDAIAERAVSYYDAKDRTDLDIESLSRRSRALQLLGEVHHLRGELGLARDAFDSARETTQALLELSPGNLNRIYDHAQSEFWVGYMSELLGEAAQAQAHMEDYLQLARQLVEAEPDEDAWQTELLYAHSNLGTLAWRDKRWSEAEEAFHASARVAQKLYDKNQDADAARELADSYSWLSTAYFSDMKFEQSGIFNQKELATYQNLLALDPRNMLHKDRYLTALHTGGKLAVARGNVEEARSAFNRARELAAGMLAIEEDNTTTLEQMGKVLRELGLLHLTIGERERAGELFEECIDYGEILSGLAIANSSWQLQIMIPCWQHSAGIALARGETDVALTLLEQAGQRIIRLELADTGEQHLAVARARGALVLGDLRRHLGDGALATQSWTAAARDLDSVRDDLEPAQITLLGSSLARLGESGAARQAMTPLYDAGYRHPEFLAVWQKLGLE